MFSFFGIQIYGDASKKSFKMLSGVASLLILVSGMGLLARLGMPHGEPWPMWIHIKLGVWGAITILTPIILKRFPSFKKTWYPITFLLLIIVLYAVQYRI